MNVSFAALSRSFSRITQNGRYRPEIDGLRFFAIAFVLFGHLMERIERAVAQARPLDAADHLVAFLVPKATVGVMLFFTISGYILGMQFHRLAEQNKPFRYGDYLLRRACRIAPPYYLVLLAGFLTLQVIGFRPSLMSLGQGGQPLTLSFLVSLLFVHGIAFGQLPQMFPPGWSLEVEAQFYVVAPVLFGLMMRSRPTPSRTWKWLVLGASFLALVACNVLFDAYPGYHLSLLRHLPFFMLGPFLVLAYGQREGQQSHAADVIGYLSLVGLGISGILQPSARGWLEVSALDLFRLLVVAGIFDGAIRGRVFRAMCSLRWISVLGGACFSIYLCHLQIMQVVTPLLARHISSFPLAWAYFTTCLVNLPVVIAVSMVFYMAIERPFMKFQIRPAGEKPNSATASR